MAIFSHNFSGEVIMVKWKNRSKLFLVAVLIAVISDTTLAQAQDERLPESVAPEHYDLSLTTTVHTGARNFTGYVKIRVRILANTDSITLHNRGLMIQSLVLKSNSTGNVVSTSFANDASKDFLIIASAANLIQGEHYDIEIQFGGNLRTDMGGFYRSQYRVSGETLNRYNLISLYLSSLFFLLLSLLLI